MKLADVKEALVGAAAMVRDTIDLIHPPAGCLPLPSLDAPAADRDVYAQALDTAGVLFDVNGSRAQSWIRARWACPHLPGQLVDEVYEMVYAWYQLLCASRHDRDRFDLSLRKVRRAAAAVQRRFEPPVARWWLAYMAGNTVAQRVHKHRHPADPAGRNPFDRGTHPELHYWWQRGKHCDAYPVDQFHEVPTELSQRRFCCQHDREPLHPTLMRANPSDADFVKYEADCLRHAAMARARTQRTKQQPPMASGADLGEGRFFCALCWKDGVEDGGHERYQPPCELPAPTAELIGGPAT